MVECHPVDDDLCTLLKSCCCEVGDVVLFDFFDLDDLKFLSMAKTKVDCLY